MNRCRIPLVLILLHILRCHALDGTPHDELYDWDARKCGEWVGSLGDGFKQYQQMFVKNGIDGRIFTHLDDASLQEIGVDKSFHRKVILAQVEFSKTLAPEFHNPNPNDFWEFRAANRKKTDTYINAAVWSPRLAMLYAYSYDHKLLTKHVFQTPQLGQGFWIGVIFFPHLQMAWYAYPHTIQYGWPVWSFVIAMVLASLSEWLLVLGIHQGAKKLLIEQKFTRGNRSWTRPQVCEFFDKMDLDKSGSITQPEMLKAMRKNEGEVCELLGLKPGYPRQGSEEQTMFTHKFQEMATDDNDKEITKEEFVKYFSPPAPSMKDKALDAMRPEFGIAANISREAGGALVVCWQWVIYPVVPWFITDFGLYFMLYTMGPSRVWLLCVNRFSRMW